MTPFRTQCWLQSKRDCINRNARPQYTLTDDVIKLTRVQYLLPQYCGFALRKTRITGLNCLFRHYIYRYFRNDIAVQFHFNFVFTDLTQRPHG